MSPPHLFLFRLRFFFIWRIFFINPHVWKCSLKHTSHHRGCDRSSIVSSLWFIDQHDPNDRRICDPAVSFRSCSLGDHGINVWNAKWKHGSDDGNRLWIRQFHLQQRNRADNFIIDHNITNCGILDLRK